MIDHDTLSQTLGVRIQRVGDGWMAECLWLEDTRFECAWQGFDGAPADLLDAWDRHCTADHAEHEESFSEKERPMILHDNPPVALRTHMGTWVMATCLICTGQFLSANVESAMRRFNAHYEWACSGHPQNRSD